MAASWRHDRAHDEHVHVDEVVGRAAHEVFVGDVASAHDGDRAVGDEELVVHAVIEPLKSASDATYLLTMLCRAQQNGLNRRTSTFGNAARPLKHRIAARPCRGRPPAGARARRARRRRASCASAGGRCDRSESGSTGRRARSCALRASWIARIERVEAERHQPKAGHARRRLESCAIRTSGLSAEAGSAGETGRSACVRQRAARRDRKSAQQQRQRDREGGATMDARRSDRR